MAKIREKFQRVAAAFDADVARVRVCESSGSEHSPESSTDHLSYLVKSFMERAEGELDAHDHDHDKEGDQEMEGLQNLDSEKRNILLKCLSGGTESAKENMRRETELAWGGLVGSTSSTGFKRRLMTRLRDTGFDAGLCKSKWEKNGKFPAGDYEYIDVNLNGKRYIVEVCLAAEFEIARPTYQYSSLLDVFPLVFVGKVEELKRVVRLMCTAMKSSMKSMDLHIPPWRGNDYMQAKWFSSYRRTTKDVATKKASPPLSLDSLEAFPLKKSIGFEARPVNSHNCRDDYGSKTAFRVSHLTAAFHVDDCA